MAADDGRRLPVEEIRRKACVHAAPAAPAASAGLKGVRRVRAASLQGNVDEAAVLYVSRLAPDRGPDAVDRLAEEARVRNERDRITGLLMFDGQSFAQWLEGPSKAIDRLLQRLRADRRHRQMDVLWFESPGLGRRFPNWHLGYLPIDPEVGGIERLRGRRGADAMLLFGELNREIGRVHRWHQSRGAGWAMPFVGAAAGAPLARIDRGVAPVYPA